MKAKFLFLFLVCTLTIACSNKVKEESSAVDPVDYMVIGPADSYPVCSDTLGSEIRMKMIQGNYTIETKEVFAIVLNPKCLSLGYGPHWSLEKWEGDHWITPKIKKQFGFFDDEILSIPPPVYYCFNFPIECYEITQGRYRISKSLYKSDNEIKLNAEFEIK